MTEEVAEADGARGRRPPWLEAILIDGLGFDWEDRSAFNAANRDSKAPRAFSGAVFEIYRVIDREKGWEGDQPGPGEIADRLQVILAALRDLRGGLEQLDPMDVDSWRLTAWGTPSRDAIWKALEALTDDAGMDDGTPQPFWRLHDALDEVEPPFAVLHEAAHAAAVWGPGATKAKASSQGGGRGRPANRPAYQVASIVAQLFRNFGQAPTYPTGTSPFKRTLHAVFKDLGITANADDIGRWAVGKPRIRRRSKP